MTRAPLVLSFWLTACGAGNGGASDDSGRYEATSLPPPDQRPVASADANPVFTCAPGELKVEGRLDDSDVKITTPFKRAADAEPLPGALHYLALDLGEDNGQILFDMKADPAAGAEVATKVELRYAKVTQIRIGNCRSATYPSSIKLNDEGTQATFTLRQLYAVDEVGCLPGRFNGELQGCFSKP